MIGLLLINSGQNLRWGINVPHIYVLPHIYIVSFLRRLIYTQVLLLWSYSTFNRIPASFLIRNAKKAVLWLIGDARGPGTFDPCLRNYPTADVDVGSYCGTKRGVNSTFGRSSRRTLVASGQQRNGESTSFQPSFPWYMRMRHVVCKLWPSSSRLYFCLNGQDVANAHELTGLCLPQRA